MPSDMWGVNTDLSDFDRLLSADDLEEIPVSIEQFIRDKYYLGLEYDLSPIQLEIARYLTQIFKPSTLVQIHGEEEGMRIYNQYTVNEVVAMAGKGGGKDHTCRVSFAYIVYLLHCLRDPLKYYTKSSGTYIDLINIAVNASQAKNVFFEPFKNLLLESRYFNNVAMFDPRSSEIFFLDRPIRCYSGHSEAEGWEGYDILICVLDEIAAFKTDAELSGETRSKGSASAIYNMASASVISRYPDVGKVALLSFPRFKGDFIQQRYAAYLSGNEDKIWGIKAASWEMNPTKKRSDYDVAFKRDPVDAEMRFACNPPEMTDAYFREPELVRNAFLYEDSPLLEDGTYQPWFNGKDQFVRFIHVDLAQKHDHAALSMVHCVGMKEIETSMGIKETLPVVKVDLVKYWEAPHDGEIQFDDIRNLIIELNRKFSIGLVSFDGWNSVDMSQSLRAKGIAVEIITIRKPHYDTLKTTIYDLRLRGYWDEFLVEEELLKLRIFNNTKVDHGAQGFKDGADALAGAVWNCITNLEADMEVEIEIWHNGPDTEEVIEEVKLHTKEAEIPVDIEEWLFESL